MLFAVLALGACLLMSRIVARRGPGPRSLDPRGRSDSASLIGLAALTRNEAIWLGRLRVADPRPGAPGRLRLVVAAGAVALLVFAPWMIRDWLVFGSPLPGQAVANAFSVTGFDIFAWNDPPTLSRYLAVGPARLIEHAGRRVRPQPRQRPAADRAAAVDHRAARPAVAGPRPGAPAARARSR